MRRCCIPERTPERHIEVRDVRLEFPLHEDHERRDVAAPTVELGHLGPDKGKYPGMFTLVFVAGNGVRTRRRLFPGEVLLQVVDQLKQQHSPLSIVAGNGKQRIFHFMHFAKQIAVLVVHFSNTRQQFDWNENLGHITPISRWKTACLRRLAADGEIVQSRDALRLS